MSSYDQNLLDEVPRATRAQLQEGYNVDLLEQPPRRTPSVRSPPPPPPPQTPQPLSGPVPVTPGIAETGSGEKFSAPTTNLTTPKSPTSFWRTRNGVITVFIIVLVVIGAVVGGAVGGTVKKSNNNSVGTTGSSSASSSAVASTGASQGIEPGAPSTTTSATGTTATGQNIQTQRPQL